MKKCGIWVLGVACAAGLLGGCERGAVREEEPPVEEAADPDRHALETTSGAFEAAFPGWTWATLRPPRRQAVAAALEEIAQGPWISLRRARESCLDALRASEVFGAETVAIVVGDPLGFEGEGLSLDQSEDLVIVARDAVSDALTRLRFRELEDEQEEARKAAASLGASPSTEALAEFSALFQAPLVISLSAKVRFAPARGDPDLVGHLAGSARALVYHRGSGTVLARVQVRSSANKALGPTTSLQGAADEVAREVGAALALALSARLFERLYAEQ